MSLQHQALDRITLADLTRLVETGARESLVVDYKLTWALQTDEQKREFLFDVASLANSGGGDLIYGVKAVDGVPTEIVGIKGLTPDREQLTAENLLRTCVSPRLPRLGFHAVAAATGETVWIVRVPRGLAQPHMVRIGALSRFYGRNSAGKYELDVHEIRRAFVASEGMIDRLREFRLERINRILTDDTGQRFVANRRLVLHVLPVATMGNDLAFSVAELSKASRQLRPLGEISSWGPQVNLDGVAIQSTDGRQTILSAIQLFRNGAVEVVDAMSIDHWEKKPILPATRMEKVIREGFPALLDYFAGMGLTPPFVVGLSLLNVKGLVIHLGPQYMFDGVIPIARDQLILPATTIEEMPVDVDQVFRPAFDLVWNASGYRGSVNYQVDGQWKPRP